MRNLYFTVFRILICLVLLLPLLSFAQERDSAGYEQFLLPVFSGRAGAFGSFWLTELHARNEGTRPVQVFHNECAYFCDCPGTTLCTPQGPTPPGSRVPIGIQPGPTPPNTGAFIYASKGATDGLAIQLHTRDTSRSTENFGTEIPVVRERDFRRGKTTLLNIPFDPSFRLHLRVFGISSPSEGGEVAVRLYENHSADVLSDTRLRLHPDGGDFLVPFNPDRPPFPSYGELSGARFPSVLPPSGRIRIEIEALTPGLVYWPFVSVINNTTQHLTLVTPQ